jgi:DNA-binding transcriptional LysR family regulator
MTQPAIGRHVSQLEESLGSRLFVRTRSGMTPTEAGLSLVEEAQSVKSDIDRFLLKAAGTDQRLSGTVRITASRIVSVYILPVILARLKAAEPALEIELVPDNAVANLLARDADIAIRMVRPTQNDLVASKVTDIPLGIFAHADYLAARGTPASMTDLMAGSHAVIGYDREDRILQAMRQQGLKVDRSMFAFRTDDEVAGVELVKAGAGIGFIQLNIAARSPSLRRVLADIPLPDLPVWLCAHQDVRTNARIRRTMDFLQQALREALRPKS